MACALSKQWFDYIVAVNQVAVITLDTCPSMRLVARVTAVNSLDAQQRADAIAYHCFRGRCTPNTTLYVSMGSDPGDAAKLAARLQDHSLSEVDGVCIKGIAGHVALTNQRCGCILCCCSCHLDAGCHTALSIC